MIKDQVNEIFERLSEKISGSFPVLSRFKDYDVNPNFSYLVVPKQSTWSTRNGLPLLNPFRILQQLAGYYSLGLISDLMKIHEPCFPDMLPYLPIFDKSFNNTPTTLRLGYHNSNHSIADRRYMRLWKSKLGLTCQYILILMKLQPNGYPFYVYDCNKLVTLESFGLVLRSIIGNTPLQDKYLDHLKFNI